LLHHSGSGSRAVPGFPDPARDLRSALARDRMWTRDPLTRLEPQWRVAGYVVGVLARTAGSQREGQPQGAAAAGNVSRPPRSWSSASARGPL